MKKMVGIAAVAVGLGLVNSRVEQRKACQCSENCWCKKPGLRNYRWMVPFGHKMG